MVDAWAHDVGLMTATLVYLHGIGAEHDDAWRDVLTKESLLGRYLDELGAHGDDNGES